MVESTNTKSIFVFFIFIGLLILAGSVYVCILKCILQQFLIYARLIDDQQKIFKNLFISFHFQTIFQVSKENSNLNCPLFSQHFLFHNNL